MGYNILHKNDNEGPMLALEEAIKRERPEDIILIAVTKTFPVMTMESAMKQNLFCLGESRVQETETKFKNKPRKKY